ELLAEAALGLEQERLDGRAGLPRGHVEGVGERAVPEAVLQGPGAGVGGVRPGHDVGGQPADPVGEVVGQVEVPVGDGAGHLAGGGGGQGGRLVVEDVGDDLV